MIKQVKEFTKEYSLNKQNFTCEKLEDIIAKQGFIILCYSAQAPGKRVAALLDALGLMHLTKKPRRIFL